MAKYNHTEMLHDEVLCAIANELHEANRLKLIELTRVFQTQTGFPEIKAET